MHREQRTHLAFNVCHNACLQGCLLFSSPQLLRQELMVVSARLGGSFCSMQAVL